MNKFLNTFYIYHNNNKMHKKIVKELIETNSYFTELDNVSYSRTIGINDYGFRYDENYISDRQNIIYFSNQFEEIINKYKEENKKNKIDEMEIKKLFYENKDKLIDLAWINVGYF